MCWIAAAAQEPYTTELRDRHQTLGVVEIHEKPNSSGTGVHSTVTALSKIDQLSGGSNGPVPEAPDGPA